MGARPSSFKKDVVAVVEVGHIGPAPTRWSPEQEAIFDWFEDHTERTVQQKDFLIVRARAGTGKTTTIIEGVNRAPETSILLCAFNKQIADELNIRISNPNAQAKTLHAVGMQAIQRMWPRMPVDAKKRGNQLVDAVCPYDTPSPIRRLVNELMTKGREICPLGPTEDHLRVLALRFDLVPDEGWTKFPLQFVVSRALAAMHHAAKVAPSYDTGIDFADMIYLPLAWDLLSKDYQLVVGDEVQDLTLAQLEVLSRVCCGRMCLVGDDKQAIYGFRGADSGSLDRLKKQLNADELGLKTTYRCGQSIVREAQLLVSDIVAAPGNPEGAVLDSNYANMLTTVAPGDFILSRLNAPLVSCTLQLLQRGIRAQMKGRDIGRGIVAIVRRLKVVDSTPMDELLQKLAAWESKMTTRYASYGQPELVERTRDQAAMIFAFAEESETCGQLMRQVEALFSDGQEGSYVWCSSVHKAKGLEADRVFVMRESFYRYGESPEEMNIDYVATTRAKSTLVRVTGVPTLQRRKK